MSDIVEIIQRLSFEVVGQESVRQSIESLKKQAELIERQQKKLIELQEYQKKIGGESVALQQQTQKAIEKTTQSIDAQTESLKKRFEGNAKLQVALNEELGTIQQLTQYIARASKEQETLTDPAQIKEYTANIKAAQNELKALITPINFISDKPNTGAIDALKQRQRVIESTIPTLPKDQILAAEKELQRVKNQLKELQTIGKEPIVNIRQVGAIEAVENRLQILKNTLKTLPKDQIAGVNEQIRRTEIELKELTQTSEVASKSGGRLLASLFGVSGGNVGSQILRGVLGGIGIGAGLSIIPSLVNHFVELARSEFDVVKQQEILVQSNENLKASFEGIADAVLKYNQQFYDIAANEKRAGTVGEGKRQLEILKAIGAVNGEVFEAEKAQFEKSQEIQQAEIDRLLAKKKVYDDINKVLENSARFSAEFTGQENVQAFGDPTKNVNVQKVLFDNFSKQLDQSGLPRDIVNKSVLVLRKAYDEANTNFGFKGVDLTKVLTDELTKYGAEGAKVSLELADAENKRNADQIKRRNDQVEAIRKLTNTLQTQLNSERIANDAKEISLDEKNKDNVIALINQSNKEKLEALRVFDQQRKEDEKTNPENPDIEKIKNAERLEIERKFILSQQDMLDAANTRKVEAEKRVRDLILSIRLGSLQSEAATNAETATFNIENVRAQRATVRTQQDIALEEQRQKALADARKAGITDTAKLEQEFRDAKGALNERQNREDFDAEAKHYNDLFNLAKTEGDRLISEILAQGTRQSKLAEDFLNGNVSGGELRRRGVRARFEDARQLVNLELGNVDKQIQQRQNTREDIINNPESTAEDIAKIDKEINDLIISKQKLTQTKAELITNENIRQLNIAIGLYQTLAQTAVQGYELINDARQRDLDREINAREQRINVALKLAERGNVQALQDEQKALRAAQQERRKNALEQEAINAALTTSNSIVAVAKAAAEGGVLAPATIAAVVAALIGGYATVKTLALRQQTTGFADGGFTGEGGKYDVAGNVHRGEFVFNAERTRQFRPLFEAIHKGELMPNARPINENRELADLKRGFNDVVDAINGKQIEAKQVMDKRGISQSISEYQRSVRLKYRP